MLKDKRSNTQHRVQEIVLTKDIIDQLATMVDRAEKALAASPKLVPYLECIVAEQSNQLLVKDPEAPNERTRASKLDSQVTSFSADLQQTLVQNMTDEELLEGIRTALAWQRMASRHRISNCLKERKTLVADRAAVDPEFQRYRADMDKKLSRLQAFLKMRKYVQTKRRKNVNNCFSLRSTSRRSCGIDLMMMRRSIIYSINWVVLSLRNVGLKTVVSS